MKDHYLRKPLTEKIKQDNIVLSGYKIAGRLFCFTPIGPGELMKPEIIEILTAVSNNPDKPISQIHRILSSRRSLTYVKTRVSELLFAGYLISEKTGMRHSLRITETGADLLIKHQEQTRGDE